MSKLQIRQGVFETNSSSTHSITIVMQEDFDKWKAGEMLLTADGEMVSLEEGAKINKDIDYDERTYCGAITFEEWEDAYLIDYEDFIETYKTPKGENVVAFGYYGYN